MSHGSGAAMQMGGGMYAVRHVNLRRTCPCLMVVDLGFVMQGVGIAKDIVREASEAMSVMRDTSSEIPVRNAVGAISMISYNALCLARHGPTRHCIMAVSTGSTQIERECEK